MISSSQDFESSQENVISRAILPKIPKIKTSTELLQTIDENDKFDYSNIKNLIQDSFAEKNSAPLAHSLTRIQLINNRELENTYETYKRERKAKETARRKRENSNKSVKLTERNLFLIFHKEEKVNEIAKNGLECEEAEFNHLGDSNSGIHFCKHIDVLLKYQYMKFKQRKEIYILVVKAVYDSSKLFQIQIGRDNSAAGASMDHNGHIPFISLSKMSSEKSIVNLFSESQIFLYDVDEETLEYIKKPRNLLPYAILKYEYKQDKILLQNIKNTIHTRINPRNAFTNRNRYFNLVNDTTTTNDIKEIKIVHPVLKNKTTSSSITNNSSKFVQSDYVPLFDESKPVKPITAASTVSGAAATTTDYDTFIEQARKQQEEQLKKQQQQQTSLDDHDACKLVKNFRPKTPPPKSNEASSIYSDDEEEIDEMALLDQYFAEYEDKFNECKEKLPKWRIMFERTGNVDHIFRGGRRMECKVKDVKTWGLKYLDEEKSKISVSNPTNNLKLTYESKRIKKTKAAATNNQEIIKSSYNDCSDENETSKRTRLQLCENSFVFVDFSYIPSSADLKPQVLIKTEKIKSEPSKSITGLAVTKSSQPPKLNNSNNTANKSNIQPKLSGQLVKKESNDKLKPKSSEQTTSSKEAIKVKEEKKDTETSKPKQPITKETAEKFKAKLAEKAAKNAASKTAITTNEIDSSKKMIKTSGSSNNLSSENTSLERRLLGIDKTSNTSTTTTPTTTVKQEPTVPKESQAKSILLIEPPRTSNIKEEMKKLIEKYKNKNVNKEKSSEKDDNKTKQLIESIKTTEEMMKKKKSFWDPDSDTEYAKLRNAPQTSSTLQNINDEEDEDDDIVIVSKQNLNLPPIQYSKQFYDSNINGFEAELRKFSPAYVSSCSSSPLNNNLSISNNTVTTVTKSPIKSKNKQSHQQQQQQQQQSRRLSNFRLNNRQRYIHHIVVNNINSFDPFVNQFDVDGLKNLKSKSQNNLNASSSGTGENVIEIHSGGFRCIEEYNFQQSASYLRRTKSFEASKLNDLSRYESSVASNKKISLNDYVNIRKSITPAPNTTISTANSNDNDTIKREPIETVSPSIEQQTHTQPLRQSIENTVLPLFNQKTHQLPSLSLIDELKKRINKKEDKSLYTNQRLIKEDDLYDDDEIKRLQTEHSKLKRSHHKKRDKSKKKIKLENDQENDLSQDEEDDDSDTMTTFASASLSSELLFDDDDENLTFSDSSISSFSSFNSSDSSASNKKKHKKSKHAKKRKFSSQDEGEIDSSQKSKKKSSNKKHKSKHKSSKRTKHTNQNIHIETSQTSSSTNEKSDQTTELSANNNSKFTTHDDDYSMPDLNVDMFDRDLSHSKNESTDKTASTSTTSAPITSATTSTTSNTTKTSEHIISSEDNDKDLDKTLVDPSKQIENYDNFYSEYDIDDAATLFNTAVRSASVSSSEVVVPKSEPKSPVPKTNDKPQSTTPVTTPIIDVKPSLTPVLTPKQPSPSLSQNTQSPQVNNSSNLITTPKTAPTQPTQSRFQHNQKQNFYTPNNRNSIRPNNSNKLNYNLNNKMNSNNRAAYANQMMPNMSVGLDVSPPVMPNMNYIPPNSYDQMNQMNYQQNMYNYSNFNEFDYQYSNNSNNSFQYTQMNNNYQQYTNNSNYSSWQSNKDKYYNNSYNNNNNYQNNYGSQRNYSRNFNNSNNNNRTMNTNNSRQQTNQQSRSNINGVNSTASTSNTNSKRAQNHDQEDGEIVD